MEVNLPSEDKSQNSIFCNQFFHILFLFVEIGIIGVLFQFSYPQNLYGLNDLMIKDNIEFDFLLYYSYIPSFSIFCVIGFGFVMTYMRFARWSGLGIILFSYVMTIQFYLVFNCLWQKIWFGDQSNGTIIDLMTIISAQKSALAIIISFTAIIGKINYLEALIISLIETFIYSLNEAICIYSLLIRDIGGLFLIHTFAGYFGGACSFLISDKGKIKGNPNSNACYSSSLSSFLGALFLWILFPVINSINPNHSIQHINLRFLAIENTFWCLTSATIVSFWFSSIIKHGKFDFNHIINGFIVPGVMIAGCADYFAICYPALLIGVFGSVLSIIELNFFPSLLDKIGLHQSRQILFLHAFPTMFGLIANVFGVLFTDSDFYGSTMKEINQELYNNRNTVVQSFFHFLSYLCCLIMGIIFGGVTGLILRIFTLRNIPEEYFGDHVLYCMNIPDINDTKLNEAKSPKKD